MAVQRIRLLGDPILRTHCSRVWFPLTRADRNLITDLNDTMDEFRKRRGFGRGIAAPQIGVAKRLIVIRSIGTMINPRIVKKSASKFVLWDDCFSFPDLLVKVKRSKSVTVRYKDEQGTTLSISVTGAMSELLQHEIDHVNGILAIDRAISSKSIVLRSEYVTNKNL